MAKRPEAQWPLDLSRRSFLGWCASAALAPTRLRAAPFALLPSSSTGAENAFADYRLTPHYRAQPRLQEILRKTDPALDVFPTEKLHDEIEAILDRWKTGLTQAGPRAIGDSLSPGFVASPLRSSDEQRVRSEYGLEIWRSNSLGPPALGREAFLRELEAFFEPSWKLETAEFKIAGIAADAEPPGIRTRIRYDLVGAGSEYYRQQRVGWWELEWERDSGGELRVRKWEARGETRSRASGPMFVDITSAALAGNRSYREQMLRGTDYWRTVLDAACGIDVYGNYGVAVGDVDNDGFDDLYVCQPSGLPNRLYRNRGDGTFEDVTQASGVGVLSSSPSALFADVDNDGRQDLVVVTDGGPLLFLNQGKGKFRLKPKAFQFAQEPQGTFTGAALADYDRDGRLDIYFCLYGYYRGLDRYRYPTPYYDAQNGPPNFLFHNDGDGAFADVTAQTGLNQNNERFSFACGWADYNHDGWPDLYVANDFGRKNLYRNNGDGTFTDVAGEAGVEDFGAGMSVCWFDYDNDGNQDLYVADMWSPAGERVAMQEFFMKDAPESVRALFRKHARGNSLFRNQGAGKFEDQSARAGVEVGRWAWASDAWDFDHDGFADLYIANGMISGPKVYELSSFFWRQVVSHSPLRAEPAPDYAQAWNAINELIRADGAWSGYERNIFYVNNHDGTFSDASGALGLDFMDDSRAFALSDFDHDGRLEVFLKNRIGPQLRVLRNETATVGSAVAFRLHGQKSNRDAIGAAITVEVGSAGASPAANGPQQQVKFVQAGSGFLSQHTKEVFFGLGKSQGSVRATVRWPSGLVQQFDNVPVGHRVEIEEGSEQFRSFPFASRPFASRDRSSPSILASRILAPSVLTKIAPPEQDAAPLPPSASETWLIDPLGAPDFSLPDLAGRVQALSSFRGHPALLHLWTLSSPVCQQELPVYERHRSRWAREGLHLVAVSVDGAGAVEKVRKFAQENRLSFLILVATDDMAGSYNVLYRYLFDRHRDLSLPTSFLIDEKGFIAKVYQGPLDPEKVVTDAASIPKTEAERVKKALPFEGMPYGTSFSRNLFSYGAELVERGYLDQAEEAFKLAVSRDPDSAEARYNLGTLYLRRRMWEQARDELRRASELKPDYLVILNNLGVLAAQQGRFDEARVDFEEVIRADPKNTLALGNLGDLYRQQGRLADAQQALERAVDINPRDPGLNYSLGMVFAQKEESDRAREHLEKAVRLRPDYPEALNNLGVLYLRLRNLDEAAKDFEQCIRAAPAFDEPYLNLARVYYLSGRRQDAVQTLRLLLERQPSNAKARPLLERLTQQP